MRWIPRRPPDRPPGRPGSVRLAGRPHRARRGDAIDAIVAPGTDLAAHEKFDTPPALLDPALRRR
ncbi:hypothetical protein ACH4VS_28745 [Streptomyces hygroscopicus]|uniref:hypothetical protein n=1 Tax=Streptomyces hygroscopicus TaxID=1912 RepID=UPI00117D6005|nr:hypothetical protein [Streptomyces hygroscopicus]